ncbi:MAG: glycine cleavage system protein GcvH [bacterium]
MNVKPNLYYTKDHEWTEIKGDTAVIGISDHAQGQLGDIVFVELPESGNTVKAGDALGVVESTKAVSDFYSSVDGVITEVNSSITDSPEKLNSDPYGDGWLVKIKFTKKSPDLMDAKAYETYLNEEHK